MIVGEKNTRLFNMIAQKSTLKLEIAGLKHSSGRSVYAHIKREYGLKGSKSSVLEQFTKLIEAKKEEM